MFFFSSFLLSALFASLFSHFFSVLLSICSLLTHFSRTSNLAFVCIILPFVSMNLTVISSDCRWAYPIISKVFYDTLSHSIVVPLSAMLTPYFDATLPSYLQYATFGSSIAREILRSITKAFDAKVMRCVPSSVNVFSNSSRMELLLNSGGMQIAYHSMLTLAGPAKGMTRMPNVNLSPTQIFFLVRAQQFCASAAYAGVDVTSDNFSDM